MSKTRLLVNTEKMDVGSFKKTILIGLLKMWAPCVGCDFFLKNLNDRHILFNYLPSPRAWPSRPVCFSKAANTNLDTVSSRVSLLRDALSQSGIKQNKMSGHLPFISMRHD